MDDLEPVRLHEERGLLDDVVTDVDDQIGAIDGAVQQVAVGQGGIAQV